MTAIRDQPCYDTEGCTYAACREPDSMESVHHVLLHCHGMHTMRSPDRSLRPEIAQSPAAKSSPTVLIHSYRMAL